MLQTNENYLNGNNSTVQVTLAHDTSEINKILISDSRQIKKKLF